MATRTMPRTKPRRSWLILLAGVVLLSVSLLSLLCHEILVARGRSPEDARYYLQRTYPLHAGLLTAAAGFLIIGGARLACGARRTPRRDG